MLTAGKVRFVHSVGVAPSTTTMELGDVPHVSALPKTVAATGTWTPSSITPTVKTVKTVTPSSTSHPRMYMPYASLEDLKSNQLGIINESDAWMTGRPYGLPGTAAVRLIKQPGGYHSPAGYHYDAAMLGDAGTDMVLQLQQIAASQAEQRKSLERIAFWQAISGGIVVASLAAGMTLAVINAIRGRK